MAQPLVPDTSVVIDGRVSAKIKAGELQGRRIVVPEAVVAELEAQANHGRDIGLRGLEELRKLSELAKTGKIELEYVGIRPNLDQIKLAGGGEIDAMIRDVALELGASFLTSDQVQFRVAEAMGLDVEYVRPQREPIKPLSQRGCHPHGQTRSCGRLFPGSNRREAAIGKGAKRPLSRDLRKGQGRSGRLCGDGEDWCRRNSDRAHENRHSQAPVLGRSGDNGRATRGQGEL
jgi:predicted nucleic acid-binding protein